MFTNLHIFISYIIYFVYSLPLHFTSYVMLLIDIVRNTCDCFMPLPIFEWKSQFKMFEFCYMLQFLVVHVYCLPYIDTTGNISFALCSLFYIPYLSATCNRSLPPGLFIGRLTITNARFLYLL